MVRSFRYVATLTAQQIVTSLVSACQLLGEARETAQRQLTAEKAKKGSKVSCSAESAVTTPAGCTLLADRSVPWRASAASTLLCCKNLFTIGLSAVYDHMPVSEHAMDTSQVECNKASYLWEKHSASRL